MSDDLINTVDRLAAEHCGPALREAAEQGRWPADLWQALEETGLTKAALPEHAGGAGLDFAEAMLVLQRSAWHALPVPLMETMLAGRMLSAAGLAVPDGALTIAPVLATEQLALSKSPKGWAVTGQARRVPWGAQCAHGLIVATFDGQEMAGLLACDALNPGVLNRQTPFDTNCVPCPEFVEGSGRTVLPEQCRNLAGEARAGLRFEAQPLLTCAPLQDARARLQHEGALMRSVQMRGALEHALELSLRYAKERVQFGRPIGAFQAVQHMLALLAGQVAASGAACDAAVQAAGEQADAFWSAVAKARVGEAAGKGAEIAHQVHGAMGFTRDHGLHQLTRRLWSWRDEFGSEAYWQERLGCEAAARGADALWPMLTVIPGLTGNPFATVDSRSSRE